MASRDRTIRGRFQAGELHFEIDEAKPRLSCNGEQVFPTASALPHTRLRWSLGSFQLLCRFAKEGTIPVAAHMISPVSRLRSLLGDTFKKEVITCTKRVAWYWKPKWEELPDPDVAAGRGLSGLDGAANAESVANALKDIATLTNRSWMPRQQRAVKVAVNECLRSLRAIEDGQLRIEGKEPEYFARFFACIDENPRPPEHIKAYIRLVAFDPRRLRTKSWFEAVYEKLEEDVRLGKARIEYVFLVNKLTNAVRRFLAGFEAFAERVSYVHEWDSRLKAESLEPSIVLMERQKIAFTHDRGKDGNLKDVCEWTSAQHYDRWHKQYAHVALMSNCVFSPKRTRQQKSGAPS